MYSIINENSSTNTYDRLKWLNVIAYLMNISATYGIGVLGGFDLPTNAEISEKYQTLITPAGFAFAIWGLIFLTQFIWITLPFLLSSITTIQITTAVAGACTKATTTQDSTNENGYNNNSNNSNNNNASSDNSTSSISETWVPYVLAVGYDYLWVCLFQIGWTLSFTFELITISVIMMLLLWFFLGMLVRNLLLLHHQNSAINTPTTTTTTSSSFSTSLLNLLKDYILWFLPFTIHFGWITAASAVNVNVLLVALDTSSTIQFYTAAVSLIVLVVGTLLVLEYDYIIPLVVTWALYGIYSELNNPKDMITERFDHEQIYFIQTNDLFAIGLILLFVAAKLIFSKFQSSHHHQTNSVEEEEEVETSIAENLAYLMAEDVQET